MLMLCNISYQSYPQIDPSPKSIQMFSYIISIHSPETFMKIFYINNVHYYVMVLSINQMSGHQRTTMNQSVSLIMGVAKVIFVLFYLFYSCFIIVDHLMTSMPQFLINLKTMTIHKLINCILTN